MPTEVHHLWPRFDQRLQQVVRTRSKPQVELHLIAVLSVPDFPPDLAYLVIELKSRNASARVSGQRIGSEEEDFELVHAQLGEERSEVSEWCTGLLPPHGLERALHRVAGHAREAVELAAGSDPLAAVDHHRLAVDVGGAVAHQEGGEVRQLLVA